VFENPLLNGLIRANAAIACLAAVALPAASAHAETLPSVDGAARQAANSASETTGSASGARLSELPRWAWPVPPPLQIVRPYQAPATPYSSGHRGIDIAAAPHESVLAPADGVVYFVGFVVDRPVLTLEHGDFLASFEPVEAHVSVGDAVRAGDVVGQLASGEHCSDCMHFGVRFRGEYVSPLLLLGGVPRAILLPRSGS
jgi:murein DD-endopeptidase MepM/ murein hydrolase activator NlpD